MAVAIGVILPTSTPDPADPIMGDVRASARFAEQLELDSIWSADHLVASAPILDSTTVLATAAAVTDRIAIGFGVMLLALRPVAWAAKQISTLQHLSGDRLVLGIGTGNPAHGDIGWRAAGVSYGDRGHRTDEALRVLPALVTGRTGVLDDGLQVRLAPGSSMPPVLIAGNGEKARRRAARLRRRLDLHRPVPPRRRHRRRGTGPTRRRPRSPGATRDSRRTDPGRRPRARRRTTVRLRRRRHRTHHRHTDRTGLAHPLRNRSGDPHDTMTAPDQRAVAHRQSGC
jgi:alkanesulfonate monooxygenase SsuD/methylene tetrahydromethanopterin reductase-like flavin-dependent oxidoreductase (luciferase family)